MNYFKEAITKKYATFTGRARRKEFWIYALIVFIIELIASGIDAAIGKPIISIIVGLFFLIPGLAISFRRLHDIGKGGGWIFINFVPLIGWIWYLVLMLKPGEEGANRFGMNPKVSELNTEIQTPENDTPENQA